MMMVEVCCDFCGANDAITLFQTTDTNYHRGGLFTLVRCRQCGLVYLNPRPTPEAIWHYYADAEYTCFDPSTEYSAFGRRAPFLNMVSRLGVTTGALCDIGCGTGSFLVAARHAGWKVAGIEPNDYARARSNERLGEQLVFSSLEEAAFSSESFDVVSMWHVMEHLPSPRRTLAEIHRLLRPRGLLALSVPNFDSLERRIWGKRWIAIMAPTHLFHFTPSTLVRYVESSGFEVLSLEQPIGADSLAANILCTLRNLLLDPWVRHHQKRLLAKYTTEPRQTPPSPAYYQVNRSIRDRISRIVARVVYPVAWFASRVGWGPGLVLYARKTNA